MNYLSHALLWLFRKSPYVLDAHLEASSALYDEQLEARSPSPPWPPTDVVHDDGEEPDDDLPSSLNESGPEPAPPIWCIVVPTQGMRPGITGRVDGPFDSQDKADRTLKTWLDDDPGDYPPRTRVVKYTPAAELGAQLIKLRGASANVLEVWGRQPRPTWEEWAAARDALQAVLDEIPEP